MWCKGSEPSGQQGWEAIMGRSIRALDSEYWARYHDRVSLPACLQWDFTKDRPHSQVIRISQPLEVAFGGEKISLLPASLGHLFVDNLFLKMVINSVSTAIMGRLGRF